MLNPSGSRRLANRDSSSFAMDPRSRSTGLAVMCTTRWKYLRSIFTGPELSLRLATFFSRTGLPDGVVRRTRSRSLKLLRYDSATHALMLVSFPFVGVGEMIGSGRALPLSELRHAMATPV